MKVALNYYVINFKDNNTQGYWTSTDNLDNHFLVIRKNGAIIKTSYSDVGMYGIRPVITISKSLLS